MGGLCGEVAKWLASLFLGHFLNFFVEFVPPAWCPIEQPPCQLLKSHNTPKRYTYPRRQNKKTLSQNAPFTIKSCGKTVRTKMLEFVSSGFSESYDGN